jgi:SMC interacting uncharacterized protein involved in chromosome segregation
MSKLELARTRFEAALAALEMRIAERLETNKHLAARVESLNKLESERDTLRSRLDALEEDSRSLAGLTEEVEVRLQDTIAEIRSALARQ